MSIEPDRTTIYLKPAVKKALKRRIIDADQTMSEYVDQAITLAIAQDLEDIAAIDSRRGGATETFEDLLKAAHRDGLI